MFRTRHLVPVFGAGGLALAFAACSDVAPPPFRPPALDAAVVEDALPVKDGSPVDDAGAPDADVPEPPRPQVRFVLLGDFGFDDTNELAVASLVKSWKPEFIVTLGDNSYPDGAPETIDETIGKYYAEFIHPYKGKYGSGATEARFFACLGNHDWDTGSVKPHQDYFELPGNERYWELSKGPVRFFCLDSDTREPDGTTADSVQGQWLQKQLSAAKDPHRIVVFHHPSHSSGVHGSQRYMQWPFQSWGASAVYNGHDHDYERFDFGTGSIPYVVQGTGGADLRAMSTSRAGSVIAYSEKHGATLVEADDRYAVYSAHTVGRDIIDQHVTTAEAEAARPSDTLLAAGSTFQYFDEGTPPSTWAHPSFNAISWKSGAAPLGYGQGDEKTNMAKGLAHYARTTFDVADPKKYDHVVLWLQRDDGAAVYLNGTLVVRSNLPSGTLDSQTLASEIVSYAAERAWLPFSVSTKLLQAGQNVVAVELHQSSLTSSDAVLDMRIEGKR